MEKKAVSAETRNVSVDRFRRYHKVTGYLAVGHPTGGLHEDLSIQLRELLPIGSRKSLGTEAAITGFARKPLDTVGCSKPGEKADFLVWPGPT